MRRTRGMLAAVIAIGCLGLAACEPGDAPTVYRPHDAVVLTGAQVPQLVGIGPGRLVAFRFVYGTWQQVPVQVDERAVIDLAKPKNGAPIGKTALLYTDASTWTGADPVPTFDADDELVFMASDLFGKARSIDDPDNNVHYTLDEPDHVVAGSGVEIEVTDPLKPDSASWIYVFKSDGTLTPGAGATPAVDYDFALLSGAYKATYDIADGPNPEDSVVTTDRYSAHFSDRWIHDELRITAGRSTGADILDRHKAQFPGSCGRSEDTFADGAGAMIANKSGPVRAIRSYLGANSGTYTQRDHLMYRSRMDAVTYLRVHQVPGTREWIDYSPEASGMTFSANTDTAGVPIDGVPDAFPTGATAWEMARGAQGAVVHTSKIDTNIAGLTSNLVHYYSDDTTPSEVQCTGDSVQFGASGHVINQSLPCTDPAANCANYLTATRRMTFLGPAATADLATSIAGETATPLSATVEAFAP